MDIINKPVDQETIDLLNQVTNNIKVQNDQLLQGQLVNGLNNLVYTNPATTVTTNITTIPNITNLVPNYTTIQMGAPNMPDSDPPEKIPSPNIDMENPIYANEFEEFGSVDIGNPKDQNQHGQILAGTFYPPSSLKPAFIGLINEVSNDENDLYAKFDDGEIIPFKGHPEKFSVEINTWNDLQKSDLLGSEIKKAATCHIMIDDRLARIIEGTDIQDLLMKADRAISELKTMPLSICRDGTDLIGREIYYDNQPAIIGNVDELNNYIYIVPDLKFLSNFNPPAYAIEDNEGDEWIEMYGKGMLIRDYDEKIWWWRNTNSSNIDPSTDPYYGQFPQPLQPPPPTVAPNYPGAIPHTIQYPGGGTSTGTGGIWTTPITTAAPYTYGNGSNITWDDANGYTLTLGNTGTYTLAMPVIEPINITTTMTEDDVDTIKDKLKYSYGKNYGKQLDKFKYNNKFKKKDIEDTEVIEDTILEEDNKEDI